LTSIGRSTIEHREELYEEYELYIDDEKMKDSLFNVDLDDDKRDHDYIPLETELMQQMKRDKNFVTFKYKKEAVNYYMNIGSTNIGRVDGRGKIKKRKVSQVLSRYKKCKSYDMLQKWKREVDTSHKHGTRIDMLQNINHHVFSKFEDAVKRKQRIHDSTIKVWALQRASEIHFDEFLASSCWITQFKRDNNISARKITRLVTRADIEDAEAIKKSGEDFVKIVQQDIKEVGRANVLNTDQSGCQPEMHSTRTLTFRGTKVVEALCQSLHASTHSYTVQPTITADGKKIQKTLLVLQEPSGSFGPRVSKTLFKAVNLVVTCSKSGKCTKEHVQLYHSLVLGPELTKNTKYVLVQDSWGGQRNEEIIHHALPPDTDLTVRTLPPKTTSLYQPLDVFFFQQMKALMKMIQDAILLQDSKIVLQQRNNIIKFQSLVQNQMESPRYVNMIKFAWYESTYITRHPPPFLTPRQFSSNLGKSQSCDILPCKFAAFLKCGWCKCILCIKHFFELYHYCTNYIP
jgi:hypothetical protein